MYERKGAKKTKMKSATTNGLDGTTAKGYMISLFLLVLYDRLVSSLLEQKHLPRIDDCPAWTWYVTGTMQGVVYPVLYFVAVQNHGMPTFLAWFRSSWSERSAASVLYEKYWLASFAAYLTRDLPYIVDSPLFIAHHLVCLGGVWFTLYIPRGSIPLLSGMAMLELGSFSFTLAKIMPLAGEHTDIRWETLYSVNMTLSNVLCFFCMLYGVGVVPLQLPHIQNQWAEKVCKAFFAALTTGLVYMRQEFAIDKQHTAATRIRQVEHSLLPDDEKWMADSTAYLVAYVVGISWLWAAVRAIWCSYQKEGRRILRVEEGDNGEENEKKIQ
mmetsp:Transcript_23669/g.26552  ORF Transcript_23669/g.26552 Transcript_23669/m.26552 type:complete len:327 (+) Transcript_23669:124-1104(+)